MELEFAHAKELVVAVVPVDLHLHRQLRAALGATRVEKVGAIDASHKRADRSLVAETDLDRFALEGHRGGDVLLRRRVAVEELQVALGDGELERVERRRVEQFVGAAISEGRRRRCRLVVDLGRGDDRFGVCRRFAGRFRCLVGRARNGGEGDGEQQRPAPPLAISHAGSGRPRWWYRGPDRPS